MNKSRLQQRIIDRVDVRDMGYLTPCWISNRSAYQNGYTQIFVGEVRKTSALSTHRAAWLAFRGPIPDDMVIDHLCKQVACCNPDHLEPVTTRENVIDRSDRKTAILHRMHVCNRGHSMSAPNGYTTSSGRRVCRACRRIREAAQADVRRKRRSERRRAKRGDVEAL